ncbi:NAD(P)/FAD-dependent oxidoreductase [Sorangium sp. So ce118]
MENSYDIVVIGSGIAGASVALCLSRVGARTLVVERKSHPRFAIGESTLPTTSILLRHLGRAYGVPELTQVCHYVGCKENGLTAWPKQHFWFAYNHEGQPVSPDEELMLETLLLPQGPDCHWMRADIDGFLTSRLPAHGVDYTDHTEVVDFETRADGVELRLRRADGEHVVRAKYVVDASGHASFLADKFDLRDPVPRLKTNTRVIFSHFRNVRPTNDLLGGPHENFRFNRFNGTQHHVFHGGWMWIIPFDNGVTSVGLVLDRDAYPLDPSTPPKDEFWRFIDRFPTVREHLQGAEAIREYNRTDRVQFTSKTILGERFILTPHAAGFVDALYSSGVLLTCAFIARFIPLVRQALSDGDFSPERFRGVERDFFGELEQVDRIVSGSIRASRHREVHKQFWKTWVYASFAQAAAKLLHPDTLGIQLYGGSIPEFRRDVARMHEIVSEEGGDELERAARLREIITGWHEQISYGMVHIFGEPNVGGSLCITAPDFKQSRERLSAFLQNHAAKYPEQLSKLDLQHAMAWVKEGSKHRENYVATYANEGDTSVLRRSLGVIFEGANPSFDYFTDLRS